MSETVQTAADTAQALDAPTSLDRFNGVASGECPNLSVELSDLLADRPVWADEDEDIIMNTPAGCGHASAPISRPLARHQGEILRSGKLFRAYTELQIVQTLERAEPSVQLKRYANAGKGVEFIAGSKYSLTASEAVQLAHDLLLAVDVITDAGFTLPFEVNA